MADVGDWVGLCWNLEVDEGIMDHLKHADYVTPESRKRDCLLAYWKSGSATWEIADAYKILYSCANKDEL